MVTLADAHRLLAQWTQAGTNGDRGYGDMTIVDFGGRMGYAPADINTMLKLIEKEIMDTMEQMRSFLEAHTHHIQTHGFTKVP